MAETTSREPSTPRPRRCGAACAPPATYSGLVGGEHVEIRGEGVGQVRIIDRPNGKIHERLTSLDDDAEDMSICPT